MGRKSDPEELLFDGGLVWLSDHRNIIKRVLLAIAKKTPSKVYRISHVSFDYNPSDVLIAKIKLQNVFFVYDLIVFAQWEPRNIQGVRYREAEKGILF